MCIRDSQNTARGLLRRISPSQAGPYTPSQQVYTVNKEVKSPAVIKQNLLCSDGLTKVFDLTACPVVPTPTPVVSQSDIVLDLPQEIEISNMSDIGPMPEFGDSHGLNAVQFFHKLKNRFNGSETDRTHLDDLFKSMGYENGFALSLIHI